MKPWERLGRANAPDGQPIELRRRGHEYRIWAGGLELMSNEDEPSSRSLAELGCAHLAPSSRTRVLVGGLGMGFTLRAALELVGDGVVEIAELSEAVVEWNRGPLGPLAGCPLDDPRAELHVGDVRSRIRASQAGYDAILLDVDNGPIALAHADNNALYGERGIDEAWRALRAGGVLAVWSLSDDKRYTKRLSRRGFEARAERVFGSRKDRGREHVVFVACKPG